MIVSVLSLSAWAASPTITSAPEADRPPMIAGEARCDATIAFDATGSVSGAEVSDADCAELFRASVRMTAERVKLSGVESAGAITLRYTFGTEGNGIPTVSPTSMPALGLPYTGVEIAKQKDLKPPKKVEMDGPVTCRVALKVTSEGLATDIKPTDCPDAFQAEVQEQLAKWEFKPLPQMPEGGAPTEIQVTFQPK